MFGETWYRLIRCLTSSIALSKPRLKHAEQLGEQAEQWLRTQRSVCVVQVPIEQNVPFLLHYRVCERASGLHVRLALVGA